MGHRVVFVTNFCPHYRVRTFEILAERLDVDFLFFSEGQEWYWPSRHGLRKGEFPHEYLPGITVARTRIVPALIQRLWTREYDVIIKCINGRFALPVAYLIARLRRRPFVLWTGVWQRLQTPAHRLLYPLTRQIYRRADAVVVYGDHVRRFLVESEGVRPERIFVAHHATDGEPYSQPLSDADRAELITRLNIPEGLPVILYAGRLEAAKGVTDLLRAFIDLGDINAVLLFVGEGSLAAELASAIAHTGVETRVRFVSGVSPESMPAYYSLADVLVLPSRTTPTTKETWGLVVNEAFYQGVPAITSDAVGAAAGGLVQHGRTGMIFPEQDTRALTHALRLLIEDEDLRRRLGAQAMHDIQTWNNERMVEGFVRAVKYVQSEAST